MRLARPLVAAPLVDFAAALDGCADVALGIDCRGVACAVGNRDGGALAARWEPGEAPAGLHTWRLPEAIAPSSLVQPLPDGVLVAGRRCRWRREGAESNARAVDVAGRVRARFTLGDGLADLRVTPDGTMWASDFDEGIFGNRGWNGPGPEPIGAAGLVAFSAAGQPRFAYRADAAGTDSICDAYALNVSGDDDAWVYFYTEFPIVRVHDGRYHVWHTNVAGATALAVRGKRALLYGDYDRPGIARLLELGAKGSATVAATLSIVDGDGTPLIPQRVVGVGANLYLLGERAISVVRDW